MVRILIADNNAAFAARLSAGLRGTGYEVHAVQDSAACLRATFSFHPQVLLLDWQLPRLGGADTLSRLREFYDGLLIVLGSPIDEASRIEIFELGADDYLLKPVSQRELLARVRTRLNRAAARALRPEADYMDEVLLVDLRHARVTRRGEPVSLTPIEFKLLACLLKNSEDALSARRLLLEALGPSYRDDLQFLKTYIYRLRHKLEDNPRKPRYIRTQRGVGYAFYPRRR